MKNEKNVQPKIC